MFYIAVLNISNSRLFRINQGQLTIKIKFLYAISMIQISTRRIIFHAPSVFLFLTTYSIRSYVLNPALAVDKGRYIWPGNQFITQRYTSIHSHITNKRNSTITSYSHKHAFLKWGRTHKFAFSIMYIWRTPQWIATLSWWRDLHTSGLLPSGMVSHSKVLCEGPDKAWFHNTYTNKW